ncbi:hypothetical protein OF83DRAFT_1178582 [Amylostereum chailletii]|nr:hypothetical protein OF83DRAFT_1178582 [Amylostereum chailletii]
MSSLPLATSGTETTSANVDEQQRRTPSPGLQTSSSLPQTPPPAIHVPLPQPQTPPNQPQAPGSDHNPPGVPGLKTTPIHYKADGYTRFSSRQDTPSRDEQYINQAEEMNYCFVGPCPFDDFFEAFLPEAPAPRPSNDVWNAAVESAMDLADGDQLVHAINESGMCSSLTAWNTSSKKADDGMSSRRADINLFDSDFAAEMIPSAKDIWPQSQLWGEEKPAKTDPFVDPKTLDRREQEDFQHGANQDCNKARGQLVGYAIAQFSAQYRVFAFSFLVVGGKVRVIRWDRSGAIVTEAVDWRSDPDTFAEFLWRFNCCDAAERGHDLTVCPTLLPEELSRARTVFRSLKTHKIAEDEPLQRIVIHDEGTNKDYILIVASPRWYSRSLVGSGTLGYTAVDLCNSRLVWLKDCWRIDSPEHMREDIVYQRLAEQDVPYTARKVYSGDIEGQITRTQDFVMKPWACKTSKALVKRIHTRLVTNKIGHPLSEFTSDRQLVVVVRDCIYAHWKVFDVLGILHRDISASNILIDDSGRGLLIDWGNSRVVNDDGTVTARLSFRSGTWQFSSALILACAGRKPHLLCDDLESFLHVTVFNLARYRPSSYSSACLVEFLRETYDSSICEEPRTGGDKKWAFINGGGHPRIGLIKGIHESCKNLIKDLQELFLRNLDYEETAYGVGDVQVPEVLSTSHAVLAIFDFYLSDKQWVDNGNSFSIDQLRYIPVVENRQPNMKRFRAKDSEDTRIWPDCDSVHATEDVSVARKRQRVMVPNSRGAWVPVSATDGVSSEP